MYLDTEKKKEIFAKYGKSNTDTGSPEAQIALFSYRISHLTEHLKSNKKDYNTERSLRILVGKRRKLLDYLIETDIERYRAIIKELNIRKQFFLTKKLKERLPSKMLSSLYLFFIYLFCHAKQLCSKNTIAFQNAKVATYYYSMLLMQFEGQYRDLVIV